VSFFDQDIGDAAIPKTPFVSVVDEVDSSLPLPVGIWQLETVYDVVVGASYHTGYLYQPVHREFMP